MNMIQFWKFTFAFNVFCVGINTVNAIFGPYWWASLGVPLNAYAAYKAYKEVLKYEQ